MSQPTNAACAPPSLISDSPLVAEVIQLLRLNSNRLPAATIADFVLDLEANFEPRVAAAFLSDLAREDERLRFTADHHIELAEQNHETRFLRDIEFVVVDVETTGARTPECRITEIGAYRVRQGEIVAEFASLVNPETAIPPFISTLTGITDSMVCDAPLFRDIADDWLRFARGAVLVAHNAGFDTRFLDSEIGRIYPQRRMANSHLCTVALSRRALPHLPSHRLDRVAEHFGVTITNRHRASGDALATAYILLRLLDMLDACDIRSLAEARAFRSQRSGNNRSKK